MNPVIKQALELALLAAPVMFGVTLVFMGLIYGLGRLFPDRSQRAEEPARRAG